ncbi:MAG TPA: carboxypeptidase-like regulatory domain-containing protein [Acidobacteriota bacterium]|nr:carboxypeptidase-like regulatory domain-containing protein [Acidobacteriota bacterium]
MRFSFKIAAFSFLFFMFSLGSHALAQTTGSIRGTVADATGAVLDGASVKVISQETEITRVIQTDATGQYLVPLLAVGLYTIEVDYSGFQQAIQKDIRLQTGENREVDFSLAPSGEKYEIQVNAYPIVVETTNPTLGQVITAEQVADLPLNGRNFTQLATLTPGATQSTNPYSQFNGGPGNETSIRGGYSLSVGGSRENATDWLLDGNDNNELTAGAIAILPSIDAIQEFKVLTSAYPAAYGTRGGPTVLVTTKSGTNQYHGSLFEYFRNDVLNARSYFAGDTKEKFNLNQFGATFGGPIKEKKTFFFASYEGVEQRKGRTIAAQVPTRLMKKGDFSESFADLPAQQIYNPFSTQIDSESGQLIRDPFKCDSNGNPITPTSAKLQIGGSPCNIIPNSMIDPIAKQMIALLPNPNQTGIISGNYISSPVQTLDDTKFALRLDHNFSANDTLFARFSYDQASSLLPSGLPGYGTSGGGFGSTEIFANHGRNAVISETHIFSPKTINAASFGFNRIFNSIRSYGTGQYLSDQLGIANANGGSIIASGLTDAVFGGGFWGVGDSAYTPFQGGTNIFHTRDELSLVRGSHALSIGGEVRRFQLNTMAAGFQDGLWFFDNRYTAGIIPGTSAFVTDSGSPIASFLLGLPSFGMINQVFQGSTRGTRWTEFRPYVQDDWKVLPNLMINLGLAYNVTTPKVEVTNRQTNFDWDTGAFLIAGSNSGRTAGVHTYWGGLEPRVGFAWSSHNNANWAVRGGYAIFHDSGWNLGSQTLWQNPPFVTAPTFSPDNLYPSSTYTPEQGFPPRVQPTDPSQFVGSSINLQPSNAKLPMIQQFNLNIQRTLPAQILLTVSYTGSRGTHLLVANQNLNTPPPNTSGASSPYPEYGLVNCYCDRGHTRYDGLEIRAETKNPHHGIYMLLGYTYSKAFDNGLADYQGTPGGVSYFPLLGGNADKGLSETDLTHNFVGSLLYDLPVGKGQSFGNKMGGAANAVLGNWHINAIAHIHSGFPLFMTTAVNNSGTNLGGNSPGSNRPNRVCNGKLGGSSQSISEWFDTSCFVDPEPGTLGDASRSTLFGPDFVNFDVSLFKTVPLGVENAKMQFRAEAFNLFNHPQFGQPGTTEGQGTGFGVIQYTVGNPRLIQFAMKIMF